MKIVVLAAGMDPAAELSVTLVNGFSTDTVTFPAQTGRTKTQLVEAMVNHASFTGFVVNGSNVVGLVNDSFEHESFVELGEITNNEAIKIGGISLPSKYAMPVGAAVAGFVLGKL